MTNEEIIKLMKRSDDSLKNKVGLIMIIGIGLIALIVLISPKSDAPSKTADDFIAEKLANGEELNWLDKKVLRDEREQARKNHLIK